MSLKLFGGVTKWISFEHWHKTHVYFIYLITSLGRIRKNDNDIFVEVCSVERRI